MEGRPHGCLPAGPPFSKHLRFCLELFLYGVDPWEVAMVTPFCCILPTLNYCLHCSQLAPTLHISTLHRQVKANLTQFEEILCRVFER